MSKTNVIELTGSKIAVVSFGDEHLGDPRYLGWLNDREVMKWIGRPEYLEPVSFETAREYVEDQLQSRYCHFLAVYYLEDETFIGTAKINFLNEEGLATRTADIGIMIGDRALWGRGLATDTLFTVSRHAFESLSARKLTAGALSENIGVIRAFKKVGYREEARLRRKILLKGEYVDHVLLGCFPEELIDPAEQTR